MPKYEVVTSPGLQHPVGHQFETDNLHPAMRWHVKLVAEGAENKGPAPATVAEDFTLADGLDGSTYDEALSLNALHGKSPGEDDEAKKAAAEKAAKAAAAKAAKAAKANGPGANS